MSLSARLRPILLRATVLALTACSLGARVARGQQACPPPTPDVEKRVDWMLASDSAELRRAGITATRAADLPVLRDSVDGPLCTRLDSLVFPTVAYRKHYYRAGACVIGAYAHPPTMIRIGEEMHAIVVDTTLVPVEPRSSGGTTPTGSARVEITWGSGVDMPTAPLRCRERPARRGGGDSMQSGPEAERERSETCSGHPAAFAHGLTRRNRPRRSSSPSAARSGCIQIMDAALTRALRHDPARLAE
jgi:hypothetical protein